MNYEFQQACWTTKTGVHKFLTTKFCTVEPDGCGFSVWDLLDITVLAPMIVRCSKIFGMFSRPL
jgi:hypothetical protein